MVNKHLKQYNNFAEKFSSISRKEDKVNRKAFYSQINFPLKNKKILDLGCGDGADLIYYKKLGAKVYGLDVSEEMINLAQSKIPQADLKVGLFEKIPYDNNFFDVVVSEYALQTSKKIELIYKEVERILKSGGIFLFLVVHPLRQFIEKKRKGKNYFKQEIINSVLFGGKIIVREPSHTILEYFSDFFLKHFDLLSYDEKSDPNNAEKINNDIYPAFMIIKARKRKK